MEFRVARNSFDPPSQPEIATKNWLEGYFGNNPLDNSVCFERWPIYEANQSCRQRRPDFLLLHPEIGILVISVKGYEIDNIVNIIGDEWKLENYYTDREYPIQNVETTMFKCIKDQISNDIQQSESKINPRSIALNYLLVLPNTRESDFNTKFPKIATNLDTKIVYKEALENPDNCQAVLNNIQFKQRNKLSKEEIDFLLSSLDLLSAILPTKLSSQPKPETKGYYFKLLMDNIHKLDREQHEVALSIPAGPQRIRGLAGTGKTVVLAIKAVSMYIENKDKPGWTVLITYKTKSLINTIYNLINKLIIKHYGGESAEAKEWNQKIRIYPAWVVGVRIMACIHIYGEFGHTHQNVNEIRQKHNLKQSADAFDFALRDLLEDSKVSLSPIFDAILIDEGQDLPNSFYELCKRLTKEPKIIIICWDDMQSLQKIALRDASTLLGNSSSGEPYSFEGEYTAGIPRDVVLKTCYRSPRQVIFCAQVYGMGLKRKEGAAASFFL